MRALASTGGATAFASAALADELPLILAETSEAFGSASAAVGDVRVPQTSAELGPPASAGAGRAAVAPPVLPSTVAEGDRLLLGLAAIEAVVALPIARATAEVFRRSAWRAFGYLNQGDFTRERLQREPRWMHEQTRFHTAIEMHPRLKEAVCGLDGGVPLGQVATIQIGRVATAETLMS